MKKIQKLLCVVFALFLLAGSYARAQKNNQDIYRDFRTEHMWDARVKIAEMISVGESMHGTRRVIPILGGTFEGPKIKGVVLPGGEDWQLVRHDGDVELFARYLMKTEDGIVFQVINRVLIHMVKEGDMPVPYIKSVLDMEAPNDSPYDYLNHSVFIGTLTTPDLKSEEEPYVIIGVYRLL